MVAASRTRKVAVAAVDTARVDRSAVFAMGSGLLPNNCAKLMSFHTPRGTFTAKVDMKVIEAELEGCVSLVTVSVALATAYVAA